MFYCIVLYVNKCQNVVVLNYVKPFKTYTSDSYIYW